MSSTTSSTQPPSPFFASPGYTPSVGMSPSSESFPRPLSGPVAPSVHASQGVNQGPSLRSPRSQQFLSYEAYHPPSGFGGLPEPGAPNFPKPGISGRTLAPPQPMTELQLPPIRPAPPPSQSQPVQIMPAPSISGPPLQPAQQQLAPNLLTREQGTLRNREDEEGREREAKRARMDLGGMLGPRQE
ncbi:MAG: hypothetical protein Q9227_002222 [Pyrenula ochraceoflavens]